MEESERVIEALSRLTEPVGGDEIPGFQISEGFAHITRGDMSDIFLVVNRAPLAAVQFSIEYAFDDFCGDDRSCGNTWFVEETDVVEHLGGVKEYFAFRGPADAWKAIVWNQFDGWVGFLPIVRACENLRSLGRTPTVEEIQSAAQASLADYHQRRHMLSVLERD